MTEKRKVFVTGHRVVNLEDAAWVKFKKKPVAIRAFQMIAPFEVETLEVNMKGDAGDWLIEGVNGELYPCKDEIFRKTYETPDGKEVK